MWIFTSGSFLSIVQKPDQRPGMLTVRARAAGDIERVFPNVKVRSTPHADYAYRANVPRGDVALALVRAVDAIDYANFKAGVTERDRHDAYMEVWLAMTRLQNRREA